MALQEARKTRERAEQDRMKRTLKPARGRRIATWLPNLLTINKGARVQRQSTQQPAASGKQEDNDKIARAQGKDKTDLCAGW